MAENSKAMEALTPELEAKLKKAGFTQTQFEPKQNQRFIVDIEGIPSYIIRGVTLPMYCDGWTESMSLTLYNPVNLQLEKSLIELRDKVLKTEIRILGPTGDVLTVWSMDAMLNRIRFDNLDWEQKGIPHVVYVGFNVSNVKVGAPEN